MRHHGSLRSSRRQCQRPEGHSGQQNAHQPESKRAATRRPDRPARPARPTCPACAGRQGRLASFTSPALRPAASPAAAVAGPPGSTRQSRVDHSRAVSVRVAMAWISGIAGMACYNWWVLVPLRPGLMRSPNEFFSNLEVTGQPYASLMSHLDVASGLLVLVAFLLAGPNGVVSGRREWLGMVVFALSGVIGGLFSQVCADGVSAACMSAERHFQLPLSQYVHDGAGVFEFAGITLALLLALRRTRAESAGGARPWPARIYRMLASTAVVAYPLLGLVYLVDRLGGVMEGVFFTGFTIMVLTQLAERLRSLRGLRGHSLPVADRLRADVTTSAAA
jgi:hypothetical protein